ncbi:MAG: GYD domain-containing protein [Rhodobacterales bacterium]
MSLYCLKIQYAPAAIAAMTKSASNREDAARTAIESVGGKLHGFYGIFGDPDGFHVMLIGETPSTTEYLATVVSAVLGGSISNIRTNALYTADEMVGAANLINGAKVDYKPAN